VKKEPRKIAMGAPIYASPVFANGVLFIACKDRLYAIREEKEGDGSR